MKKRMIVTAAVTLTLLGLAAGCGGGNDIGEDRAKEIALEDAGVAESDISRFQSSKERDDGRTTYEIQFSSGDTEYDYEINAENGDILSYDTETAGNGRSQIQSGTDTAGNTDTAQSQDDTQNSTQDNTQNNTQNNTQSNTQSNTGTTQTPNVQISEADAKAAALERVPGATEQDLRMELEHETEYEFEIDANTGNFLKWSEERA